MPSDALILLTMGDACGIGPEIIVRAFQSSAAGAAVVVGDAAVMRRAAALLPERWPVARLDSPADLARCPPRCVPVWQPPELDTLDAVAGSGALCDLTWGRVDARAGAAAALCVQAAVASIQRGVGAALVTAPLNKAALAAAGIAYPGHTEMLQALAARPGEAAPAVRMMLANDELRVVLVTIHLSLRQAIEAVTRKAVLDTLRIAEASRSPGGRWRIAVAGLNPHAGEDGLFGDEERLVIAPAIATARAEGIDAHGPFAPDTVFMRARRGEFDLVVAMTHDHGLIPVKYLGVEQGVNVTLGLPFVRTSPDHGTAFDIAGRGVADASSLQAAISWARRAASAAPASVAQ